jgi:hypothetical protein
MCVPCIAECGCCEVTLCHPHSDDCALNQGFVQEDDDDSDEILSLTAISDNDTDNDTDDDDFPYTRWEGMRANRGSINPISYQYQ